jgi:flagellar biosynthesis/type III secretory pathway ATPase
MHTLLTSNLYITPNVFQMETETDIELDTEIINEDDTNETDNVNIGQIISVKDGVAFVTGLEAVQVGEMVDFIGKNIKGMALNLENEQVGCIIFGDDASIQQDDEVKALKKLVTTPVGHSLLGRVVDGIGNFIDGGETIEFESFLNVERKAPGVITRHPVTDPMLTGYKIIDSLLPIGRGQRELIVGDRQTGKTTIGIDTILNQRYNNEDEIDMYCIYVAIGQKKSSILNIQTLLQNKNAAHYTILVAATAAESAAIQFIAPYTGCAIAEYFRDQGDNALIIYDDLTKHSAAYRQLSLLLRRPPGREAFPGDVFYAHSRLLERSCKLNSNFGGGSLLRYTLSRATKLRSLIKPRVFSRNYVTQPDTGKNIDHLPAKIRTQSIKRLIKTAFYFWILYIRSYFRSQQSSNIFILVVIPCISVTFLSLANLYPDIFSCFTAFKFFMYLGVQLVVYDELGSRISQNILTDLDPVLQITTLVTLTKHPNIIIRHGVTSVLYGIFPGKTAMSSTGRVALVTAAFTGSSWLLNCYFDRKAAAQIAKDNRKAAAQTAEDNRKAAAHTADLDRAAADLRAKEDRDAAMRSEQWKSRHTYWTQQHTEWRKSSRFTRGPEPKEPKFPESKP